MELHHITGQQQLRDILIECQTFDISIRKPIRIFFFDVASYPRKVGVICLKRLFRVQPLFLHQRTILLHIRFSRGDKIVIKKIKCIGPAHFQPQRLIRQLCPE